MFSRLVLLFVKAPVRGQVKTRIAAVLGENAALELYLSFGLDILSTIDETGLPVKVLYTPADSRSIVAAWLGEQRQYAPQEGTDLGSRMENAFRSAFGGGTTRAILVGSDLPDLPGDVFREAFRALEDHDAVIGPAQDGGYYLIGFCNNTFLPDIFMNMAWGTNRVFRETRVQLEHSGLRVHRLREWRDVDTADDLRSLRQRSRGTAFERSRSIAAIGRLYGTM